MVWHMNLADVAFLVGPVGAVVLVPLALVLVAVNPRPRWVLLLGIALSVMAGAAWFTYWGLWGAAFDYADAYRPVPAAIEASLNTAMALSASGGVLLTGVAIAVRVVGRLAPERVDNGNL